jgi:membrane-associated PAP2 superfamily phosphatase
MTARTLTASSARPDAPASPRQILGWTLLSLACLIAWDMSGWDLPMARWFGDSQGFALRSGWFMVHVAHEGARMLAWLLALGLALCIWWPVGVLRQVAYERRVQLVASALLSLVVMALLKRMSTTSCPWDLAEFGGVGHYVSHWALGLTDGGGGHCFPAGHASAGFAFLSLYFALRHSLPRAARLCLAGALAAGFALGLAQQMRGAHFMSHTLWTAWLCWTAAWAGDLATTQRMDRHAAQESPLTLATE